MEAYRKTHSNGLTEDFSVFQYDIFFLLLLLFRLVENAHVAFCYAANQIGVYFFFLSFVRNTNVHVIRCAQHKMCVPPKLESKKKEIISMHTEHVRFLMSLFCIPHSHTNTYTNSWNACSACSSSKLIVFGLGRNKTSFFFLYTHTH